MPKELISTDPGHGYEEVGRIKISTKEEIKDAVAKARGAYPMWRALSVKERAEYFRKFLALHRKCGKELAELMTREMGKPITESLREVDVRAVMLERDVDRAEKVLAPKVLDEFETYRTELHLEPFGVCASIAPWNFPTSQFFIGVGQPLLSGNTVVFKHSEECPLSSKFLADLMDEAGFPDGVFTCLYGAGDVGKTLMEQDIDLISFTGSSKVGEMLYKIAAEKFIPAVLEMGGSSPAVVFEDVDIKKTAASIFGERFGNCGQICAALKRLYVHESILDELVAELKTLAEAQTVGDPLDAKTTVGPLVAERQLDLLETQVDDARKKGATIVTGGKQPDGLSGAYFLPTILTNVTPGMRVVSEEVFGPVLPVMSFKDEKEAIAIANSLPYGLSAFVYSKDAKRADRVASALESGQVSINGFSYFSPNAPFGGYKRSGIGRMRGNIGFYYVTQEKVIARPK